MNQRILWMLPKCPLPAIDGARVANVALIRGVTSLNVNVDLFIFETPEDKISISQIQSDLGVSRVFFVKKYGWHRNFQLLEMLFRWLRSALLPPSVAPYAHPEARQRVSRILENDIYSAVVFEGPHPAAVFSHWGRIKIPSNVKNIVYRAHNVEAALWRQSATRAKNPLKKIVLGISSLLMSRFENSLAQCAKLVATVSEEDKASFEAILRSAPEPKPNITCLPIGVSVLNPTLTPTRTNEQTSDSSLVLGFLGRLDWPPNREGLTWFLKEVWPEIRKQRAKVQLKIAGSGDGSWLSHFIQDEATSFLGRIENVADFYHSIDVSLAPIFTGSGARVKVIEASLYERPSFGTQLGIESAGLVENESYIRAEKKADWIIKLNTLQKPMLRQVGNNARTKLKPLYDTHEIARRLAKHFSTSTTEENL
jgi:glycosyltransferase involved in cell wall biosynthesis